MFRVQDNVPEVYVNYSRDFQLFCRLYDIIFTGIRYSIDSMEYLTDSKNYNVEVSELLQKKLGIFNSINVSDKELKYLIDAFPYIIRNKGNVYAIESILRVFQRITADPSTTFTVDYTKFNVEHSIQIDVSNNIRHIDLIREVLQFIVPTGYTVTINEVKISPMTTTIALENTTEIEMQPGEYSSKVTNDTPGIITSEVGQTGVNNGTEDIT